MSTIHQRIAQCLKRHPDWAAERVQRSIQGSRMMDIRQCMNPGAAKEGVARGESGGLDSLRDAFGKETIQRRRMSRLHLAVERFIAGPLKKRRWMKDADVRVELGVNPIDYALVRQEHANLLMEPTDENRRKVLIWVHPEYLDEAAAIINGERA